MRIKHPAKSDGFIDYDTVFKLIVGRLKLPKSTLDDMTYREIVLLIEQDTEDKQEYYETMVLAFQLGYTNAHSKGKNKKLFANNSKNQSISKFETIEDKKREIEEMKKQFGIK